MIEKRAKGGLTDANFGGDGDPNPVQRRMCGPFFFSSPVSREGRKKPTKKTKKARKNRKETGSAEEGLCFPFVVPHFLPRSVDRHGSGSGNGCGSYLCWICQSSHLHPASKVEYMYPR